MDLEPIASSPLNEIYRHRGALMERRNGWQVPIRFSIAEAEREAVRTSVAMGEFVGAGALDLVGSELGEFAGLMGVVETPVGEAVAFESVPGSPARWLQLTRSHARIVLRPGAAGPVRVALEAADGCLHITDVSSGLTTLALVGPRGPDLLARLVRLDTDPRAFADHRVAQTGMIGVPLLILRWDRGPLLSFELTVGRDVAEYVVEAVEHAGHDLGLAWMGAEALTRLE